MTNLLQTESQALKLHIFYAGNYYNNDYFEYKLHSLFLRLKLFESAMITMLRMRREYLITKEKVNLLIKGLRIDDNHNINYADELNNADSSHLNWWQKGNCVMRSHGKIVGVSTLTGVCDDLELFFEKNVTGKYPEKSEITKTYFLPSLTEEEMQLVEMKDENHLETYAKYTYDSRYYKEKRGNPDVDEIEMKLSDSKYKYVNCSCERKTFLLDRNERTIDFPRRSDTKEPSEKSKKCQII